MATHYVSIELRRNSRVFRIQTDVMDAHMAATTYA